MCAKEYGTPKTDFNSFFVTSFCVIGHSLEREHPDARQEPASGQRRTYNRMANGSTGTWLHIAQQMHVGRCADRCSRGVAIADRQFLEFVQ